jgi:fused signal recognition particle receptor
MLAAFKSLKDSLNRTRQAVFGRIVTLFGQSEVSPATWEELETILIQADMGAAVAGEIVERMQTRATAEGIIRADALTQALREELRAKLGPTRRLEVGSVPTVVALVGVNGSGKTTTAAKLARYFQLQKRSVMLAAADTFRAAAVDQLQVWGQRLNVPVIAGQPNADPGAVAYDAVQAGIARNVDLVLVDTAGRLHTRFNLMEELKKVHRVVGKALPGAPHAVWLVLDATTGQNAIIQARAFKDAVKVSGVILAKLDSSARGGMAFAIQRELGLPILYAGLGEKPEDLTRFDREAFVDGILSQRETTRS